MLHKPDAQAKDLASPSLARQACVASHPLHEPGRKPFGAMNFSAPWRALLTKRARQRLAAKRFFQSGQNLCARLKRGHSTRESLALASEQVWIAIPALA